MSSEKEQKPHLRVMKIYPVTEMELRSIKSYNTMFLFSFSIGTFIVGRYIFNEEVIYGAAIISSGICFLISAWCYWQRYKILSDIERSLESGVILTTLFT